VTDTKDWPDYPDATPGTIDLAKIRYEAEVSEVAKERTASSPPTAPDGWPEFPNRITDDAAKAVYAAQVEEARSRRKSDIAPANVPAGWPEYPRYDERYAELSKLLYDAEVKRRAAPYELIDGYSKLEDTTDVGLMQNFHETIREIAKGAIAGADRLPQLIITAAGAIVTLYTGLLGLVFAAGGETLPSRALIPALFLGLSIALATGYAAYLTNRDPTNFDTADGVWQNASAHTNAIVTWINSAIEQRATLLRLAVVALGLGVLFLPSAFVDLREAAQPDAQETSVSWPAVFATSAESLVEQEKALFEAQVSEAAKLREAQLTAERDLVPVTYELPGLHTKVPVADVFLWSIAIGALLIAGVVSVTTSWLGRRTKRTAAQLAANPSTS